MTFIGWVLVVTGVVLVALALRRPYGSAGRVSAPAAEAGSARRRYGLLGVVSLLLGGYLAFANVLALANLNEEDLRHPDDWVTVGAKDAIHVAEGSEITARLEVGSNAYAVFPVDWKADKFRAAWDLIITRLDVRERDPFPGEDPRPNKKIVEERASITIGLMDQNAASIDDRDHVGGSGLQACFSDDIRLRGSDVNNLLKTASSDESGKTIVPVEFKPQPRVALRPYLDKPLHCELAYDGPTDTATLKVTAEGQVLADLKLEELRDFTNSVAWFGITVKGYNRYSKQKEFARNRENAELKRRGLSEEAPYQKPVAECQVRNIRYWQP
ncbi:MAG: hypothetical protein HY320_03090 [Armatimonadetes bacterium]|nr:hypothetical protein [Armatimonadota bacterium]